MNTPRIFLRFVFVAALAQAAHSSLAAPAVVRIEQRQGGWQLMRSGQPYFVKGAVVGPGGSLDALQQAGANSIRTHAGRLDEAQQRGLTALVGLPLGNPRQGFNYADTHKVEQQFNRARDIVRKFRDHPALVFWNLGNEPEIHTTPEQRVPVWREANRLAEMVKREDPNHPVMVVIGGQYADMLHELNEHCPALDLVGLNSYAQMLKLPEEIAAQGWTRPYVVTEFGPRGHWQVPKTAWKMPIEDDAADKADFYRRAYEHSVSGQPACLGSYVFYWAHKQEKTHTWYGMFLPDGSRTPAIDTMTFLWSGRWPTNRCPALGPGRLRVMRADGRAPEKPGVFAAGEKLSATVDVSDPDGDPLRITWELRPDVADNPNVGGDWEPSVEPLSSLVLATQDDGRRADIRLPAEAGKYRLFVYAHDGQGNATTANMPLLTATASAANSQPKAGSVQPDRPVRVGFSEAHFPRLKQALAPLHAQYDPTVHLLREPFHSPGYHTTLKGGEVHSTRSSLTYAVALLDTGEEPLRQRAEDILEAVIALQDADPESRTYGIWPWFLEEPLAKMSPPDWNWADFCGVQLLQVALDHRERLSPEMRAKVDAAIRHAARSIQRRNIGPGYTNIAIMGSYVTLVAAELYDWPELREYALSRWRKFCDHTRQLGGFSEYNSPTYTVVALQELGRMRLHVRDAEMRRLTEEVYRVAWEEIARHFHSPTRQWAGPHSRSYSTLLRPDLPALINRATDGRVPAPNPEPTITEHRVPVPCPHDLEPLFTSLTEPREQVQTFVKSDLPVIGTTYLEPSFALGSVNRGDFWNQRRALLAYWGSASEPAYLHVRFLRDDYDFAAAQCFSAQRRGDVLAAVVFATDGGNTHVSLDRLTNGVVRARDLRLRFELGGANGRTIPTAPTRLGTVAVVPSPDVTLQLTVPYVGFGNMTPLWQAGGRNGVAWLDLVLYSDTEREFRLAEFKEAVLALAVRISHGHSPTPTIRAEVKSNRLALAWDGLRLSVPVCPDRTANLQRQVQWGTPSPDAP